MESSSRRIELEGDDVWCVFLVGPWQILVQLVLAILCDDRGFLICRLTHQLANASFTSSV